MWSTHLMATYDNELDTPNKLLGDPSKESDEEAGGYWSTDEEVLEEVQEHRANASKSGQDDWREGASEAFAFVAGQQWEPEDEAYYEENEKALVTFNRVGPIINAVCGQQICNRQETRFLPRENGDMRAAEVWTQVVGWAREQCDAEDEESDAFRDLVCTGMGWTGTTVSYDEDSSGMIVEQRTDCRRFRWDPASRKKNLADARWVQCDYFFDDDEIEERWPDAEIEIKPTGPDAGPPQPHDATNAWRYSKDNAGKDEIEGKYRVIHEIHWRLEDTYQIADQGSVTKLTKPDWDKLVSRLKKLGMAEPKYAKTKSRVYYEAWVCGNTVLEKGKYPHKQFEYQAMTGLRDEEGQWYGLVKPLMDPQRFANKTFTQIIQIINSNAKGGIVVEDSAVTNHGRFEEEWSKSDGVSWVADGAVAGGRIMPKPPPQIPAELTKLLEYSVGGMREVTGVNVEFLGQTDKVQPGVVEAMRTKAGLVILAPWFDAMRLYMKRQGRLLGEYIYTYISDGRWVRISGLDDPQEQAQQAPMGMQPPGMPQQQPMGDPMGAMGGGGMMPPMGGMQPQQQGGGMPMVPAGPGGMAYVQLIKQEEVLKYDIVVDEATQSRDSRERYFQALMTVVPMALQAGVPVPPEVIKFAPLPESLRVKWLDLIKKQQNQPQQPPLPLLIEQARGQTQKELQDMKQQHDQQMSSMENQLKMSLEEAKAHTAAATQMYQAQSEQAVEQNRQQLDAWSAQQDQAREKERMTMESRFNTFEIILNAAVDLMKNNREMQMQAQQQAAQPAQPPTDTLGPSLEKLGQMMAESQQGMQQMMQIMAAPEEIVRDAKGVPIGKRKVKALNS
jgi:hypothetical protein